jgi:hypothetical protein
VVVLACFFSVWDTKRSGFCFIFRILEIKLGFVTGRIDNRNLARASYRQQMAEAIAAGIIQYFR